MKRFLAPAIIAVAALAAGGIAIAATGSDDGADSTSTPSSAPDSSSESTPTVNLVQIEGLGPVLTDSEGRVLYTADEEADPDVLCTDACEEFWAPAEAGSAAPTGASGVTDLDVAERPDGTQQTTHEGRRLYTFTLDEPGEAGGEGFSDTFDGQRFTWHAVVVDTDAASATVTDDSAATTGSNISSDSGSPSDTGTDAYPGY
jgi:predicted lipoprotein with Yx(FWY)xxD motif